MESVFVVDKVALDVTGRFEFISFFCGRGSDSGAYSVAGNCHFESVLGLSSNFFYRFFFVKLFVGSSGPGSWNRAH